MTYGRSPRLVWREVREETEAGLLLTSSSEPTHAGTAWSLAYLDKCLRGYCEQAPTESTRYKYPFVHHLAGVYLYLGGAGTLMGACRLSDNWCDHPPNRRAKRAFALAASFSLSFGGAVVSSEASNRSEILAMSSTAE
jgi:hypothetical protein